MPDIKMNPVIKKRWVGALRSGEYPQGVEALRAPEYDDLGQRTGVYNYCCLGVLAEVDEDCEFDTGPVSGVVFTPPADHQPFTDDNGDPMYSVLPDGRVLNEDEEFNDLLRAKFGISSEVHTRLIKMNDDEHQTFDEIADYIEEVL